MLLSAALLPSKSQLLSPFACLLSSSLSFPPPCPRSLLLPRPLFFSRFSFLFLLLSLHLSFCILQLCSAVSRFGNISLAVLLPLRSCLFIRFFFFLSPCRAFSHSKTRHRMLAKIFQKLFVVVRNLAKITRGCFKLAAQLCPT